MTKKPEAENGVEEVLLQALVPEEEQPYKVPGNWLWVKMSEIGSWGSGGTPSRSNPEYYQGSIMWFKTGELNDSFLYSSEEKITEVAVRNSSAKLFPEGTVLVAMYGATIGRTAILGLDASTNQACAAIVPYNALVSQKYLFYYLQAQKEKFIALGKGGAQPNISQTVLKEYPIPLPPLPEQQRIVSAIESLFAKLDRARELLEEVQDAFEEQKATILARAFRGELTAGWREEHKKDDYDLSEKMACANPKLPGDSTSIFEDESIDIYFEIPNTWKWMRMRDCCEKFQYGTSEKSEAMGKMPVLRMGNLQYGEIVWDDLVYSSNALEIEKYRLKKNDILFNRTNSPELVGKTAIYKNEMEAIFAGYLIRVRANSNMDPNYINFYLNSIYAKKKCQIVKTDGVSQSNINAAKLGSFEIPVAPLAEQQEIIRILDDLLDQSSAAAILCDQLEQIDQMKKTILAKAFRGELNTNDPAEESAEKLLRDVLQQRAAVGAGKAKAKRMPLEAEQP